MAHNNSFAKRVWAKFGHLSNEEEKEMMIDLTFIDNGKLHEGFVEKELM